MTSPIGVSTINRLFNTSNPISKYKAKDGDTKESVAPESNNTTACLEQIALACPRPPTIYHLILDCAPLLDVPLPTGWDTNLVI